MTNVVGLRPSTGNGVGEDIPWLQLTPIGVWGSTDGSSTVSLDFKTANETTQ